jgi:hypothetical protein
MIANFVAKTFAIRELFLLAIGILFSVSIERFRISRAACSRLPRPSYHNSATGGVIGSTTESTRTVISEATGAWLLL